MFKKRKKADSIPQSHTAYLTTIDGAFIDDKAAENLVDQSAGGEPDHERYDDVQVHGDHDAAGKAGAPKGSVRFGEGTAPSPRYFSMDPKSGEHLGDPAVPAQPPVNHDLVDDIEQRIIEAAGSRSPEGAEHGDRAIRARGSLIFAAVLAVILVFALAICVILMVGQAAQAQTQQTAQGGVAVQPAPTTAILNPDESSSTNQTTVVPELASLIGSTEKQALAMLGHGAQVSREVVRTDDRTQAVKRETAVLTSAASSDGIGSPIVHLDFNEQGAVVAASYRGGLRSLGYGPISINQAVSKSKVIQHALLDAGITVADASVIKLPKNRDSYTTYESDQKTVARQAVKFAGTGTAAGMNYRWTASLTYDYSKANNSANLANTYRVLQVGVSI